MKKLLKEENLNFLYTFNMLYLKGTLLKLITNIKLGLIKNMSNNGYVKERIKSIIGTIILRVD